MLVIVMVVAQGVDGMGFANNNVIIYTRKANMSIATWQVVCRRSHNCGVRARPELVFILQSQARAQPEPDRILDFAVRTHVRDGKCSSKTIKKCI